MAVFFTSDTHFGHTNIIEYCNRPFESAAHMNHELIARWNQVVSPTDKVFHLGDVGFMSTEALRSVLWQLNGRITLIVGNHDNRIMKSKSLQDRFTDICPILDIKVLEPQSGEHVKFVLCHYAMRVWEGSHRGVMHLYGHSHGSLPDDPTALSMDVGIDTHPDLRPYSLDEVLVHMYKKSHHPVDHHGTTGRY